MSRPYLKINSVSYASPVLTLDYAFYKLRSATPTSRTLTLNGFSASVSITQTHDSVDYSSGRTSESLTFSVPSFGTQSSTTYTAPTLRYVFGGTVSDTNTNLKFTLNGILLGSVTASGATLSTFLSSVASSLAFSATNSGYSVSSTDTTLVFSGPSYTGNLYNGVTVSMVVVNGASAGASFTYSLPTIGTFSGGTNNYAVVLSYTNIGGSTNYTYTQGS